MAASCFGSKKNAKTSDAWSDARTAPCEVLREVHNQLLADVHFLLFSLCLTAINLTENNRVCQEKEGIITKQESHSCVLLMIEEKEQ